MIRLILLVAITAQLVGCGSENAFVGAVGTVTVGGQSLSGATITLEPINGTHGPNATVPILDGHFEFDEAASLQAGTYRVRIAMMPAEILAAFPPEQQIMLPPKDAVISPVFDANSTLTCSLQSIQTNNLQFEIEFL